MATAGLPALSQLDLVRQRAAETLDRFIGGPAPVVMLDFPNHPNIGDSLIWLGTLDYLRQRGARVVHATDHWNYSADAVRRHVERGTTVLFHGGGNFGDLYPLHHSLRLRFVRDFPDARVVVLPQSVHYKDRRKLEEDARVFRAARRYRMLARDDASLPAALQCDPQAETCPDMAHFLDVPAIEPNRDFMCLIRLDEEGVDNGMAPAAAVDWPEHRPKYARAIQLVVRKQYVVPSAIRDVWTPGLFEVLARERLRRGALLLGAARVVVTDRLHAVLLALLMGRRVVALDNSYGKIKRYSATWLSGVPGLYFAGDMKQALQLAAELGKTGP